MSRPFSTRSSDSTSQFAASSTAIQAIPDVAERCQRWAELVAVGATPLPVELSPTDLRAVLTAVARLRRKNLVQLVARAIADDLHRDRDQKKR